MVGHGATQELLLAWVHPYDRVPSLLDDGPDQESLRRAVEAMAEDVKATLPAEARPELRLVLRALAGAGP